MKFRNGSRCVLSVLMFLMVLLVFSPVAQAKKLNVITSTTDLAALAREVGGDRISVESIAKGYQDPHFVEAKPSFLLKLRNADLLIVVGLELEIGWLPPLSHAERQSTNPARRAAGYLDASQFAEILEIPQRTDHARDGRRASPGQSPLLARSGERPARLREGNRRQAVADADPGDAATSSSVSRISTSV